jgi:hypothetical protein
MLSRILETSGDKLGLPIYKYDVDTDGDFTREQNVRSVPTLKLYEGSSLTAWGANPLTPITGLKSEVDVDLVIAQSQAIEKFCRNTDATDETIEMLLLHSKQLSQLVLDMKKGTEPTKVIQPSENIADMIREFNKSIQ